MTIALSLLRRYWLHALVLGALAWGGYKAHAYVWQNGYNAANVRAEQVIAEFARAEAAAQKKAREAEQAKAREVTRIAAEYEAQIDEIRTNAGRLAADLRTGNVRLRDHWAGCETNRVSGDATAARLADEARQLQAESLERIAAITGEADAKERALQEYAREVSK